MRLAPWPYYEEDEVNAVTEVLKSGKVNYWTGLFVKQFEEAYASYHGMKYGIALANGTVSLELALIGLGIGPGDEVITTPRTFIASASCIVRVGGTPVLAEVDFESQNITAETIEPLITPKTKAIIVVHLAGWPCEMDAIMSLARKHGLKVIEDCAQAHGAHVDGKLVGSFGDVSSFSFCQDKIISTGGEGGMLLLNDFELYKKMWAFKDHGKSYDAVFSKQHPRGFRWLHESFGTNWRMTEMQAAIGLRQLKKLSDWVEKRNMLAKRIISGLSDIRAIRIPEPKSHIYHAYYKLYGFVKTNELKPNWDRDRIMSAICDLGIPCFSGSCSEIYLEKAFTRIGYRLTERLPIARQLGETSLMWMVHPTLDTEYADEVVRVVRQVFSEAQKETV